MYNVHVLYNINQGWGAGVGAGAGCFWLLGAEAAWRKKNQEPKPLGKKSGGGAAKKLAGSSAQLEDKKHKEIVLL